jgi:hypothetical protein
LTRCVPLSPRQSWRLMKRLTSTAQAADHLGVVSPLNRAAFAARCSLCGFCRVVLLTSSTRASALEPLFVTFTSSDLLFPTPYAAALRRLEDSSEDTRQALRKDSPSWCDRCSFLRQDVTVLNASRFSRLFSGSSTASSGLSAVPSGGQA